MAELKDNFKYEVRNIMPDKSVVFTGKHYRITVLSERLIRLEYSKKSTFFNEKTTLVNTRTFEKPNFEMFDDDKSISISTRYFALSYLKNKPFKGSGFSPESNLKINLIGTDKVWYYKHPEVRNFKGSAVSLDEFNSVKLDKGLYSVDGFVSIDDSNNMKINQNGFLEERDDENIDIYVFMYKKDFGLCLSDYFKLTSYPPMLPKYALGIWWNRDRIYNEADVYRIIKLFKKYEIPLSVMLLSEFWHVKDKTNYNKYKSGYTFNKELYNDPVSFINNLHDKNIYLGLNLDPSEGVSALEPAFKEFASAYPVDNMKNVSLNLTDNNFIQMFMDKLIYPLNNLGVDFYWMDYNKNIKNIDILNYYLYNSLKEDKNNRKFLLSRNSGIASHKYGVHYSGETIVDFKTLNYLPQFNSSSSNIGLSWWSHDVGGFKGGIEDSELYLRYVQFSCFSPIFRFSAKRGPYYKREPWLWDVKTQTIVKSYCQMRYKLMPYLYSENYFYHKTGMPIVQPLYYINPEIYDEPTYKNEYYFGSEFIVAPITKTKNLVMNRSVERIYLPDGVWYDFETGKKFIGDKRYVTFYKDENYPVFVKAGAVVPLSVLGDEANNLNNPVNMELNIFPGKSNVYQLYEDDGISNAYENGDYHITAIEYNYMANNYTLIIRPLEGTTEVLPPLRNYFIKFRNTKEASEVSVYLNGDAASNRIEKYFDDVNFIIKIYDVDVTKQLTINCRGSNIEIDAVRIINEDINSIINDLKIQTDLKEKIANIIFSTMSIKKKRIEIRKLKKDKLDYKFINMFLNLLEYMSEI